MTILIFQGATCILQVGKLSILLEETQNGWIINNKSNVVATGVFLYGKVP